MELHSKLGDKLTFAVHIIIDPLCVHIDGMSTYTGYTTLH